MKCQTLPLKYKTVRIAPLLLSNRHNSLRLVCICVTISHLLIKALLVFIIMFNLFRYSISVLRSISFYFTDESTSQNQDRSLAATTVSPQSSCKSTRPVLFILLHWPYTIIVSTYQFYLLVLIVDFHSVFISRLPRHR